MLFDAENTAGLECLEASRQGLIGIPIVHPIVEVAESQHEVRGTGRGDVEVTGAERRLMNGAHAIFLSGHPRAPPFD